MDNTEENIIKPRTESTKIDGISAQINLSPGSETHRRFAKLMRETGSLTARSFVEMLMDAYETPASNADDQATIEALQRQIRDLQAENQSYDATLQNKELEISELNEKLTAATNTANENAVKAQSIELSTQGAIIIKPNPVVAYFLQEMAAKTGKTPSEILQALYIDDLQNPRANNLPYTVPASRIRDVMEQLKQQPQNQ